MLIFPGNKFQFMERREFIKSLPLAAGIPLFLRNRTVRNFWLQDDDATLCNRKFQFAATNNLKTQPIGQVVIEMGKSFLGTDYAANTLEQPGPEHLVINLRGLDCVTFCENSLALARCIKQDQTTFDQFKASLQLIRYRGGIINGYPSRLHYFSDAIYDGVKKGIYEDVTEKIGGVPYQKKINFMSTHPDDYPKLKENPEFISRLKEQEEAINRRNLFHIPKDKIDHTGEQIHSGDILAITTAIEGIDVSHTGMALWQDGKLHFMHAPNVGYKVQITSGTLSEYLASHSKQLGIMVARPVEIKP